jgi:hypothetical protein
MEISIMGQIQTAGAFTMMRNEAILVPKTISAQGSPLAGALDAAANPDSEPSGRNSESLAL